MCLTYNSCAILINESAFEPFSFKSGLEDWVNLTPHSQLKAQEEVLLVHLGFLFPIFSPSLCNMFNACAINHAYLLTYVIGTVLQISADHLACFLFTFVSVLPLLLTTHVLHPPCFISAFTIWRWISNLPLRLINVIVSGLLYDNFFELCTQRWNCQVYMSV